MTLSILAAATLVTAFLVYLAYIERDMTLRRAASVVAFVAMFTPLYWAFNTFAGYAYTYELRGEFQVVAIVPTKDSYFVVINQSNKEPSRLMRFLFGEIDPSVRMFSVAKTEKNKKQYQTALSRLEGGYMVFGNEQPDAEQRFIFKAQENPPK